MSTTDAKREFLLALYQKAVATAHPKTCIARHLPEVPNVGKDETKQAGQFIVVGAGKASAAMAEATVDHYKKLGVIDHVGGIITTRYGYERPIAPLEMTLAGHPVPDAGSIEGARRALQIARSAGPNDFVLCLLSGGASALWSAPVDGVTLEQKQELTKLLLRSGARISEMNCVRKHLSQIKGGRLAAATFPAKLLTLAISDVPGDDPDAIGSGPTVGDPTTSDDAKEIIARYGITPPQSIIEALNDPANETLKPNDAKLGSAHYQLIATPKMSLDAGAAMAREAGYDIEMLGDNLEGEARDVARRHGEIAKKAHIEGRRVAILSGGEFTVTVKGNGAGGPNQEYALGLALGLDGHPGISAVAGDTDGTDGGKGAADDPAGALVFPDTLARAAANNLNAANFLENNDTTNFFQSIGDLIVCGPTQTNVNDFRVILVDP